MKPTMARLTVARTMAAITLIIWKKGVSFDAKHLKQAARAVSGSPLRIVHGVGQSGSRDARFEGHFNKSEPLRVSGFLVHHNVDFSDCSMCLKQGSEVRLSHAVWEISNVRSFHFIPRFLISGLPCGDVFSRLLLEARPTHASRRAENHMEDRTGHNHCSHYSEDGAEVILVPDIL
jgi:hypothetical protein